MSDTQMFEMRDRVRAGYAKIARLESGCCGGVNGGCAGADANSVAALAASLGYAEGDLAGLPEGANMGLSCGNPTAIAALRAGEIVLDLGSGGGFDVFIAGRKVGPAGRAIGVDMTPEMLSRARRHLLSYRERSGMDNVEFRLGEIEHLPVADHSVDVVISNCVINLSSEKAQVWREIARVLKPGGRVAVSDIALLRPLPSAIREMVSALVGCIAGAVLVEETEAMIKAAGLSDIAIERHGAHVDAMVGNLQDAHYAEMLKHLPAGARASDYLVSLDIRARKPAAA
jgi:SAM-dependent methyltransferase